MDLRQLRVTQAPRTTKGIVFLLLGLQVAIGVFCLYLFLQTDTRRLDLIQSSAYALGAGIPLFAVALMLVTSRSGLKAVESRITELFLDLIPGKLSQVDLLEHDPAQRMTEYRGRRLKASGMKPPSGQARIAVGLTSNASTAFYSVQAPCRGKQLRLWLSVDLKMDQATVCLRVPEHTLACEHNGTRTSIASCCPSTVAGAQTSGGYSVDPVEFPDQIDGIPMRALILRKTFGNDEFLWESASTYGFVSDLALMIASFMKEAANLLATDRYPPPADPFPATSRAAFVQRWDE